MTPLRIDRSPYKPHLVRLAPGCWECCRRNPIYPWIVNVGSGKSAKEAYDYCVNADKYRRFYG